MEEVFQFHQTSRNGVPLLHLSGSIDIHTCSRVHNQLVKLANTGCPRLEIDLSRVRYLDSTGIRVLLAACARLRKESRLLLITALSPEICRVFRVLKLENSLQFGAEAQAALPALVYRSTQWETRLSGDTDFLEFKNCLVAGPSTYVAKVETRSLRNLSRANFLPRYHPGATARKWFFVILIKL